VSDSPRREDSRARRRGSEAVGWSRDAAARATAERARDRARPGGPLAGALAIVARLMGGGAILNAEPSTTHDRAEEAV